MMEKKYELVAWTRKITDKENARLYVIPSVMLDLLEPYITEVTECRNQQEKDGGYLSLELARRFIRVYEQSAYCILEDGGVNWVYYDTDLRAYSYYCGELRNEFLGYCEEALSLAHKYGLEHILDEQKPKRTLEFYWEQTKEKRDLKRHLKEMSAWQ